MLKKDEEAIGALRESAQILEEINGPNSGLVFVANSNLSRFFFYRNRYTEAEPYARKALAVFHGERQHMTAVAYANLGDILHGLDKLNEAEAMFRKALAIHQDLDVGDSWSVDHANAYHSLGKCLHHEGRLDEAEAVYREAERRFRGVAPDPPQYIAMLSSFGSLLVDRGKYPEADQTLCRALGSLERLAGQYAGHLALCRNALAACRAAQGRTAEADSLFRLSTPQAWTEVNLPASRRVARVRALRFYEAQGRADMVARIRSS